MKKLLFLCICSFVLTIISCSQDTDKICGSISGVVKDQDNGHLINHCKLSITSIGKSCETDSDGKFLLSDIAPGTYAIWLTKAGYPATRIIVNVEAEKNTFENILLKWSEGMATEFSGGDGSKGRPYVIETGGQLMLISREDKEKYYVLNNDIDLGNTDWDPVELNGHFDGKGFAVKNLNVSFLGNSHSFSYSYGLFSRVYGSIQNLTIDGVRINAGEDGCAGALVGYCSGSISNCNVNLTSKSIIIAGNRTGGLVGSCSSDINNCHVTLGSDSKIIGGNSTGGLAGFSTGIIQNCMVSSNLNNSSIKGDERVGGLAGTSCSVKDCHSVANVYGNEIVGGLVGVSETAAAESGFISGSIINCSATGHVEGDTKVGGIVGLGTTILRCKSDVSLIVNNGIGAGICGDGGHIEYSYSKGTIKASSESIICGIAGGKGDWLLGGAIASHCYSTMTSSTVEIFGLVDFVHRIGWYSNNRLDHSAFVGNLFSEDETNKSYCTNITSFFKSFNISDSDKYWNYSNTWTWEGTIEGKNVKVSCPKLAWEK